MFSLGVPPFLFMCCVGLWRPYGGDLSDCGEAHAKTTLHAAASLGECCGLLEVLVEGFQVVAYL